MRRLSLIWKVPLVIAGTAVGLVLLLLVAVACVLYVPCVRQAVVNKGLVIANDKTDYDIDLGHLYLSPFHHSPMVLYRAYKGEGDLPLRVEIDSLFVGHRGQDTLAYVQSLRLKAVARTSQISYPKGTIISNFKSQILQTPIVVEELRLAATTFHSDSLIKTVGVDATVGRLEVTSSQILIAEGRYPLHGLRLDDADVHIDLRGGPKDSVVQNPQPLKLAFEVPDGELNKIHFGLTPLDLELRVGSLATNASIDVGGNRYDARQLDVGGFVFGLKQLRIPADTIYGNAFVDLASNHITSKGLHVRSDEMGAKADLYATEMDLKTLRVDVTGDTEYQGSKAHLRASYAIKDEIYDAQVHIDRVDLSPFVPNLSSLSLAGDIEAKGRGINPKRPMRSKVKVRLDEAIYGPYNLSHTSFEGSTDSVTSLALAVPGLDVDIQSPMPLFTLIDKIQPLVKKVSDPAVIKALTSLEDLTVLDTIRPLIPAIDAAVSLRRGSPIQAMIDSTGVGFQEVSVQLHSDTQQTTFRMPRSTVYLPASLRMPTVDAALDLTMEEGKTDVSLGAETHVTDGAMTFYDLCSDIGFRLDLARRGGELQGDGRLTLDSIYYRSTELGNHAIDLQVSPSQAYAHALRVDIVTEDIPISLIDGFVTLKDIDLHGAIRASASVDGLPRKTDISAEVEPIGVSAEYKPYEIGISLGQTPITMMHNKVDLNGLPVYGADSTYLALYGGLNLDSMQIDVTLRADSFAPVKLAKGGPIPVYGELATDIRGRVSGPLNDIVADVDLTLLPVTDITYPIDKKNLAQVKPYGTVNVRYGTADGALDLGGQIHVDEGLVKYSPKAYPIMPFRVDSGSYVAFHGPVGKTELHVSASQKVKADVESEDEDTRRVDFTTGVRVNGELDSIGLGSIGFFLEAPDDEVVTDELASVDEETREGLAATLLATGMYVGESNVAAQRDGYALSSIINSRLNAAMANSKMGKFIDIDISSGQSSHASGTTNDMNISISKSFFKDKLRLTLGSTLTDNPEINDAKGLFSNFTADYALTKDGDVLLRLYSQRDYNNVLEGELYKSGLAVRATKDWKRQQTYQGDTIQRIYGLSADAGVAYRSNNSIGPDLTLKSTIRNLLGKGEQFTLKGNGSYFWALRNRHPGDPKKTDTYKLGANASLVYPYLHWAGEDNPKGDTRYMLGYQYENIAGGYGVHKLSGSFTYFIQSPNSPYITHAFTPFSLSVVLMKAENDSSLWEKSSEFPELIKVIAGNEFVPSIGYSFNYDNYRDKRHVNTFLSLGIKESGNLINALYCLFGAKWDDKDKKLGSITFNQFVKLTAELRNKFNFTDQICIATRLFAGTNIPLGNSLFAPLSEAFYTGGPLSLRAASPYAYGPGNFYSTKYNQNFFHAGDVKLEANFEFRFPIVWKLYGAAFVDAGNVWSWVSIKDIFKAAGHEEYIAKMEIPETLYDGILYNPEFAKQIALGTGAGLRLDIDGLVVRLDLGVGIHAPYQTYRYNKNGQPDLTQPIRSYFNIPSALDALRVNFGIGYPF